MHLLLQWFFLTIFVIGLFPTSIQSQSNPLVRTPSLSPDGQQISFTYQGDIWTMPTSGGIARRLTIHESYEAAPEWSPDGKQIAFYGNRWGNNDIYVMNADGGRPIRLTHHSTSDTGPQWTKDGSITFSTRRAFLQVEREAEIYTVSQAGGTPYRSVDAVGLSPNPSSDGKFIALVRGNCRVAREAYQGPANRNIWIYNTKSRAYHQITSFEGQDIKPNWGGGDLYYLSAQNGRYNIYKQDLDGQGKSKGAAVALTNFSDEGITDFDVSHDGKHIIFERSGAIYTQTTQPSSRARMVNIQVSEDDRFDPIEHTTQTRGISDYALSPDEKKIAMVVRGELFLKPNDKEKNRAVALTNHPFRDKDPVWINDSTLIFSSDRSGQFELYRLASSSNESDLYKTFKRSVSKLTNSNEEDENPILSPDGKHMVWNRGRGKLMIAGIDSLGQLSNERALLDGWDSPGGVTFSPDSKWLAYSLSDLEFNEEIYVHPIDGSRSPVNVSLHPRGDANPKWSEDGSKLGFLSTRNNGDRDVWFVWLKKSDWEKTQRDWEEDEDDEPKKDKKDKKKDEVEPIQIDFEDIHERIVQVTRLAGNEGNLTISKDGETFYFTTNGGGRQGSPAPADFLSAKWDGSDVKTLFSDVQFRGITVDKGGKNLYAVSRGGLVSMDPKTKKQTSQRFSAKMDINHVEERKQVFDEAWRRLRDGFYDPEFHGQNWDALKSKYYDRCVNASTDQDFMSYYNDMLGQLNASHMGLRGGTREETQRERTGLLGIEVIPNANGVSVTKVVPNTPADRTESMLAVGDIITAVNGNQIGQGNIYSMLNGQINERTLLDVTDATGASREVIIRPTSSIRSDLYNEWVKERKRLTEKYSNGKLGYIHIQGMNWPSFERFERELTASGLGKEGLVIDVRFNGGGWTTDMLMTVLNVRQHSFTIPRGAAKSLEGEKNKFRETYPFGERLPFSSWTRPSIALCNENSYSNAEIFSHAYQALDLGTLVGRPTFGAVISTGGAGLLNGSFVRMPFRAWYVKSTNKNMEHGPAVPDIEVFNPPDSKAKGEDPQLQKAVEQLLKEIGN